MSKTGLRDLDALLGVARWYRSWRGGHWELWSFQEPKGTLWLRLTPGEVCIGSLQLVTPWPDHFSAQLVRCEIFHEGREL